MPARTHIPSVLLLIAIAAIGSSPLYAQTSAAALPDELVQVPGGYLGITEEGALTRIGHYDRALRQVASSAVFGLRPVTLAACGASEAVLLASPLASSALFGIPLSGPPEPRPIWRADDLVLDRIVASGELDTVPGTEVLIAGDSAVVLVGSDGRERFRLRAAVLGAFLVDRRLLLVTADAPAAIVISMHSIDDGVAAESRTIAWLRGAVVALVGSNPARLAIAGTAGAATVYLVEPGRGLRMVRYALKSVPHAFVPFGRSEIAALSRSYPSPELTVIASPLRRIPLEYPLSAVFESAAISPTLIALVTADSAAIYDRQGRLLRVGPAAGSTGVRLIETGPDAVLLTSAEGSTAFAVDRDEQPWYTRHWPWIVAGLAGLAAAALIAAFLRRYAEVRSIYFNLVDVPSTYGVIVLSRTQRVRRMNGSAQALLGISPYIPLGRHLSEYLNRDDHRIAMADARRLFSTGESFERRVDVTTDGVPRALTFRGRTLLSRGGFRSGYLLLVEDVTLTIEKERLVNWASVAHHIAHEMKTPLGTVRMTAEMLRERIGTNGRDEEVQRATGRILKQSERLRAIVEDLLTVARTESLQKVRADIGLLMTSLVHEYGELMPAGSDLRLTITGEDLRATVDVQQLTVALRNLLDNARHAIGAREGGRLSVSLAGEERSVRITVEDNGVGMRPETLAKLFQPFYSEREGGSGIGTVIIKRVFEAHGGNVHVVSTPGVGTRFTLELPRGHGG